jgi:hypothetical protein
VGEAARESRDDTTFEAKNGVDRDIGQKQPENLCGQMGPSHPSGQQSSSRPNFVFEIAENRIRFERTSYGFSVYNNWTPPGEFVQWQFGKQQLADADKYCLGEGADCYHKRRRRVGAAVLSNSEKSELIQSHASERRCSAAKPWKLHGQVSKTEAYQFTQVTTF